MATLSVTTVPWLSSSVGLRTCYRSPSASLSLFTGTRRTKTTSVNNSSNRSGMRSALLHCSFMPTSSSFCSSFAGLSLGLDLSTRPQIATRRFHRLVVRAGGKYVLCQTKRNRSRKSLARTHGFRRRMKTTSGRALLKRRRDKGRKVLCTKSNHNSGKHRP